MFLCDQGGVSIDKTPAFRCFRAMICNEKRSSLNWLASAKFCVTKFFDTTLQLKLEQLSHTCITVLEECLLQQR
jgi:hypothetical protein